MQFSSFARKFTAPSGILELMDDMGKAFEQALSSGEEQAMLGGGNPAQIPRMNELWRARMEEVLADGDAFTRLVATYDSPQGRTDYLDALAALFAETYGWNLSAENIAITNGSQSAFFYLFNLFGGKFGDGSNRKILFPLMPEYIGYADQGLFAGDFRGIPARLEETGPNRFKYRLNLDALDRVMGEEVPGRPGLGAVCVSRPTNPTGNVLTDDEIAVLADYCAQKDLPFLVDNAYGLPFPGVIYTDAKPFWKPGTVLCLSLSKLGLPGARTGIVIADPPVIRALSSLNAILSLSNGSLGQVLTQNMIVDRSILSLSAEVLRPYYRGKSLEAQALLDQALGGAGIDYRIHESEGAFFLWLWLPRLEQGCKRLYERLKERRVLVVPGTYFFYGLDEGPDEQWGRDHGQRCLRLSFARESAELERGIGILAEELRKFEWELL